MSKKTNDLLLQCHETSIVSDSNLKYLNKRFEPNCYEITNEIAWLSSPIIRACSSFKVPKIVEASIAQGYICMEYIEEDEKNKTSCHQNLDALLEIASELHSIISSNRPFLKYDITSKSKYIRYLKEYSERRIFTLEISGYSISKNARLWLLKQFAHISIDLFTIVQRDLRVRHLLWSKDYQFPFLIDWEYTNISDPAQDVSKIIYEHLREENFHCNINEIISNVSKIYFENRKIKNTNIFLQRIQVFLIIILLENNSSLVLRKPTDYEKIVSTEIDFINSLLWL